MAGLVDLDEVRAFFELLANHGDQFVRAVGIGCVRQYVLLGVVADGILVAAENIDRIAADAQARPGNQSSVDRIAHGGIGGACAFCSHIALGGESGHQVVARRQHSR